MSTFKPSQGPHGNPAPISSGHSGENLEERITPNINTNYNLTTNNIKHKICLKEK